MSGFDHCPDEDVFKAFWSSECYHWFLREIQLIFVFVSIIVSDVLYFREIRVRVRVMVRYYKRYYVLCLICILGVRVFVCCLFW